MHRIVWIGATLLAVFSTEAAADCERDDLQGRWRYTSLLNLHDEEGLLAVSVVENCRIRIDSRARIISTRCDDDFGATSNDRDFFERRVRVEESCFFEIHTPACDYVGQFAADKRTASGVGFCFDVDRLTFDLVKE